MVRTLSQTGVDLLGPFSITIRRMAQTALKEFSEDLMDADAALGTVLTLLFFKRQMWPITELHLSDLVQHTQIVNSYYL